MPRTDDAGKVRVCHVQSSDDDDALAVDGVEDVLLEHHDGVLLQHAIVEQCIQLRRQHERCTRMSINNQ